MVFVNYVMKTFQILIDLMQSQASGTNFGMVEWDYAKFKNDLLGSASVTLQVDSLAFPNTFGLKTVRDFVYYNLGNRS